MVKNCYQNEHDARNGKLQQGNYASTSIQGDEQLFVMQPHGKFNDKRSII
jgi:hypothetical protein